MLGLRSLPSPLGRQSLYQKALREFRCGGKALAGEWRCQWLAFGMQTGQNRPLFTGVCGNSGGQRAGANYQNVNLLIAQRCGKLYRKTSFHVKKFFGNSEKSTTFPLLTPPHALVSFRKGLVSKGLPFDSYNICAIWLTDRWWKPASCRLSVAMRGSRMF